MDIADSVQSITGPPAEGLDSTCQRGLKGELRRQAKRKRERQRQEWRTDEGSGKAEIRKRASKGGREEGSTLERAVMKGEGRGRARQGWR